MSTHSIQLVGTLTSPYSLTSNDVSLYSSTLIQVIPDSISVLRSGPYTYNYSFTKSFDISVTGSIYFLKVKEDLFRVSPVVYDSPSSFSFSQGTLPVTTGMSWLQDSPCLYVFPSSIDSPSGFISPIGLVYSEDFTTLVSNSGMNVVEWSALSQGSISASGSSLDIGSGILFCWILKKKNLDPVNTTLFLNQNRFTIDIANDVLCVDPTQSGIFHSTSLILSNEWQMLSIWIGPNQIKTWINQTATDTIIF